MEKLLCPSMMCADFGNMEGEVKSLEKADIDIFHIDIMDGRFVPNFGMGLQDAEYIIKVATKPVEIHLMIDDPGNYVEKFSAMGADIIYVHVEADNHCPRTLQKILDGGTKPGIAINPGTSIEQVECLLPLAEYVLVMTVNPGFAGQKYLSFVNKKIDRLLSLKDEYGFCLMIDGACSPEIIYSLSNKGANGFVLGTSALFGKDKPYGDIIRKIRNEAWH